jgi:hypothetical protein
MSPELRAARRVKATSYGWQKNKTQDREARCNLAPLLAEDILVWLLDHSRILLCPQLIMRLLYWLMMVHSRFCTMFSSTTVGSISNHTQSVAVV